MLLSKLDALLSENGVVVAKSVTMHLGRTLLTGLMQGYRPEHTGTKKTNHATLKANLLDILLAAGVEVQSAKVVATQAASLWGDPELCSIDRTFACYVKWRLNSGDTRQQAIRAAITHAFVCAVPQSTSQNRRLTPEQKREVRHLAESYLTHSGFFPSPDRVERMADASRVERLKEACLRDAVKGISGHYERKLRFYTRATGTPTAELIGTDFYTKVMRNFYAAVAFGNDDRHVVQYPKAAAQSALKDDVKRLADPEESRVAGYNSDLLRNTSISMTSREVAACDLYVNEEYANGNPLDDIAVVNTEGENLTALAVKELIEKTDDNQRRFLALMGGIHCEKFTAWCKQTYGKLKGDNSDWREQWSDLRYLRAVSDYMGVWLSRARRFLRAVARALCRETPAFAF